MSSDLKIAVLEGDGIGHEVIPAARAALDAALARTGGAPIELIELPIGMDGIRAHQAAVPPSTLEALEGCDGWILGPHDNQSYPDGWGRGPTPSGVLRRHFELYANHRPSRALPGVEALRPGIDVLIVRENTEGLYADRNMLGGPGEFMPTEDIALSLGVFTRRAIDRVAHAAFKAARERRGHVTVVHKANVLQLTSGLFLRVCREVAEGYPDVRVDDRHVDALVAELVRRPEAFDVLVCENMLGDIVSELAAELAGGLGLAPSLNVGERWAMAQATHGAAPDIAGRGVANPVAAMLSTSMLLRWLGRDGAGELVERAVTRTLQAGVRTADLGGTATTSRFADSVAALVGEVEL